MMGGRSFSNRRLASQRTMDGHFLPSDISVMILRKLTTNRVCKLEEVCV
jgi:hypothetical protein